MWKHPDNEWNGEEKREKNEKEETKMVCFASCGHAMIHMRDEEKEGERDWIEKEKMDYVIT